MEVGDYVCLHPAIVGSEYGVGQIISIGTTDSDDGFASIIWQAIPEFYRAGRIYGAKEYLNYLRVLTPNEVTLRLLQDTTDCLDDLSIKKGKK